MDKQVFLQMLSMAILGAAKVNVLDGTPLYEVAMEFSPNFDTHSVDQVVIQPFLAALMSHQVEHKADYITVGELNGRISVCGRSIRAKV